MNFTILIKLLPLIAFTYFVVLPVSQLVQTRNHFAEAFWPDALQRLKFVIEFFMRMRIVKVIVAVPERTFHPFATLTVNRMDDIEEYNWENDRCVNLSRS